MCVFPQCCMPMNLSVIHPAANAASCYVVGPQQGCWVGALTHNWVHHIYRQYSLCHVSSPTNLGTWVPTMTQDGVDHIYRQCPNCHVLQSPSSSCVSSVYFGWEGVQGKQDYLTSTPSLERQWLWPDALTHEQS